MGASFYNSALRRVDAIENPGDVFDILGYAFQASQSFAAVHKVLDEAATSFRQSDKTAQDRLALAKLLETLPWDDQVAFWENQENEGLKEYLPKSPDEMVELENQMLTEAKERGARILERLPDMSEEFERIDRLLEETQGTQTRLVRMERAANREAAARIQEELDEQNSKLEAEAEVVLSQIKEAVFAESSVSEEEATEWAKSKAVQVSDATLKFMASPKVVILTAMGRKQLVDGTPGPDKETIQKEIATIYRLTNGNLKSLKITTDSMVEGRSGFSDEDGIYWRNTRIDALYHEAGHALDYQNKTFVTAAQRFIQDRATGKPATLNKIVGKRFYRSDERAYPDHFIDPYVGKIYPDATEVVSMGLQAFANIRRMRKLMQNDPEHLKLTLGTMTAQGSKLPDQDQLTKAVELRPQRVSLAADNTRRAAWHSAVDKAVEAVDLKNRLMSPKGFRGLVIRHAQDETGRDFEVRRSRGTKQLYEFNRDYMPNILRFIYLCIAQDNDLLPDMGLNMKRFEGVGYTSAPAWFTPITELPRI